MGVSVCACGALPLRGASSYVVGFPAVGVSVCACGAGPLRRVGQHRQDAADEGEHDAFLDGLLPAGADDAE
ncbi:hypothetical protein ACWEQ8_35630, partial [Streptomyces noursei]